MFSPVAKPSVVRRRRLVRDSEFVLEFTRN